MGQVGGGGVLRYMCACDTGIGRGVSIAFEWLQKNTQTQTNKH